MQTSRETALREIQRQQARAWGEANPTRTITDAGITAAALERADRREQQARIDGDSVRAFAFSYPLAMERMRWARTREIIHRVAPGPLEDAAYIEMLGRQAASVEIILRKDYTDSPSPRASDICDRVLIATVPSLSPAAWAGTVRSYSIVCVSAGLIDFMYQVAKLVILSCDVSLGETGQVSVKGLPSDIDGVLQKRPELAKRFLSTYVSYLFDGRSRIETASPPAREYQVPLTVLVNFNERFVLAHEYSHTLFDSLGFDLPDNLTEIQEEFQADLLALQILMESGAVLDAMPPNVSALGAFFVLMVFETLRRALDIARHGQVLEDSGFAGHPPVKQRFDVLAYAYRNQIDSGDTVLSIKGALMLPNALLHLWRRIEGPFTKYASLGRPLAPIWEDLR